MRSAARTSSNRAARTKLADRVSNSVTPFPPALPFSDTSRAESRHFLAAGTIDYAQANELAMKLAIRFWQEQGQPRKYGSISRWIGYHGSALGALSATGHPARRRAFAHRLRALPRVAARSCLRCPVGALPENCAEACLDDLKVAIQREHPDKLAAFIADPVVGAAAGVLVPPSVRLPRACARALRSVRTPVARSFEPPALGICGL